MLKKLFLAVVFLSLVASCVKKPSISALDMPSSDTSSLDAPSVVHSDFSPEKYMLVKELSAKGKAVFFYQDQDGYMHYHNGKKDRIINREIMDKYKKMGAVPMGMSYGYDGKYVYFSQPLRWGPKKLIFIKLEQDGSVVYTKELSALEQVLRPASMAFDGKGGVLLSWLDETPPLMNAVYKLIKEDNFSEQEALISYQDKAVLFAQSVHTDKGLAVVYSTTSTAGYTTGSTMGNTVGSTAGITMGSATEKSERRGEIRVRFLSDGSEKLLYSGKLYDADLIEGKGVFLLRPYEQSLNIKLITFNTAFDRIKEHTIEKPKELGEAFSLFSNGGFSGGEPFVLGAGSPPLSVEVEGRSLPQKPNLFYSYAGKNFERFGGQMPFMFSSELPSFDSSEKYTVVAYMDRRIVTPTVMVAVFSSGGMLVKKDVIIEKPGVSTGSPRVAHLGGDVFRVFYPVEDKGEKVWIYRAKDIKADSIESLYELPSGKDKMRLLTESVETFSNCRKNNDYGCVYDLLDPAYRSQKSKAIHAEMMKSIGATIMDFKFENCKILADSVFAACDGYIKAKLPEEMRGDKFTNRLRENERIVEQEIKGDLWVFIDGTWYYVLNMPMLGYALQW
ncbi:MAG: hypothetical protein HZB62_06850 [Nitrospirae bacterium]|nr:hypothetical protein [Nitrospirota bacterium]